MQTGLVANFIWCQSNVSKNKLLHVYHVFRLFSSIILDIQTDKNTYYVDKNIYPSMGLPINLGFIAGWQGK